MKYLDVAENMPLEWYLEQEELVARTVVEPTMFFWRVDPTVIIGRHQVLENEVNVAYCETHGVRIVRRKSGGGCVYADRGNLMLSYISPDTHSEAVFAEFLSMVADALSKMGFKATTTSHNDILVDGHKVCGCACYALSTGTIVHSTMMLDVNIEALEQAITPTADKLQKHGVESVRQRVINLATLGDVTNMEERLKQSLSSPLSSGRGGGGEALVIFDLDGTLLNTIDDLGEACNHALAAYGFPVHMIEEYPRLVGNGISKLIERALPEGHKDEATVLRLREVFIPYYNAHNRVYTRPYEGIPELLAQLKVAGYHLAVASNKYDQAAKTIVEHYFPGVFDIVLGERAGVERKPNPQIVFDILNSKAIKPIERGSVTLERASAQLNENDVLYVGDSIVDIETARNAGLPCIACTWGFVERERLIAAQPDFLVDKPDEILNVAKQYLNAPKAH